jgi:hypothetical protein
MKAKVSSIDTILERQYAARVDPILLNEDRTIEVANRNDTIEGAQVAALKVCRSSGFQLRADPPDPAHPIPDSLQAYHLDVVRRQNETRSIFLPVGD